MFRYVREVEGLCPPYFHFYTLNLEKSVLSILHHLGAQETTATRR